MIGVLVMAGAFSLSSPAFSEGGNIPSKYTCDAGQQNPSPALAWSDAPANARSFVLIMHDPDAPMAGGFTHWVLFDIPVATRSLPEGFQPGSVGVSGTSGFRRAGYGGPCPPSGTHHYHFMLSAPDVPTLGLQAGATKADGEKGIQAQVIRKAERDGLNPPQANQGTHT